METYTLLRAFADSWWLVLMTGFFLGVAVWTLRPGSRDVHDRIADIPLRDDAPIDRRGADPDTPKTEDGRD